jgi:hypothetical protein
MVGMKHPIWIALGAGLAVLLIAMAMPLWHMLGGRAETAQVLRPASVSGLPWQVAATGDGRSQVFGLTLGDSRLVDVAQRFGDALQLALVARVDEVGTLEALVDPMSAGFVSGRLVVGFDVPEAALRRWRAGSLDSSVMAGGVRRFRLRGDHLAEASGMAVASLSFIPSVRLSEADVRERFGPPAESRALADQTLALLYPDRGLLALVQSGSRGLLQYVAPAAFDARLRAPLAAVAASGPAGKRP